MSTPANALDITLPGLVQFDGSTTFTAVSPTTTGSVPKSNGTTFGPSSSFLLDSNDIMTNTAQPVLNAFCHAAQSNVTGDGTAYTIIFDSVPYQQGSNYNAGTGTYTVPKTGVYLVTGMVTISNLSSSFNAAQLNIQGSGGTFTRQLFNPGLIRDSGNNLSVVFSGLNQYSSTNTIVIQITISGGTKTVGIVADSFGQYSYLGIMKVA